MTATHAEGDETTRETSLKFPETQRPFPCPRVGGMESHVSGPHRRGSLALSRTGWTRPCSTRPAPGKKAPSASSERNAVRRAPRTSGAAARDSRRWTLRRSLAQIRASRVTGAAFLLSTPSKGPRRNEFVGPRASEGGAGQGASTTRLIAEPSRGGEATPPRVVAADRIPKLSLRGPQVRRDLKDRASQPPPPKSHHPEHRESKEARPRGRASRCVWILAATYSPVGIPTVPSARSA